jgi:hypothetical protein
MMTGLSCRIGGFPLRSSKILQSANGESKAMNTLVKRSIGGGLAVLAAICASASWAQYSPGSPTGLLDQEFQLQKHPQLEFAASAPSGKYQPDKPSARRRKADDGDTGGDACNLQCPPD